VDNGWTALVVLLLGDPHLLEGGERGENGTTDPDRVLALWWGDDLDLHRGWCKGGDFLLHTVGDTWVHGSTTGLGDVRFSCQLRIQYPQTYHDNVSVKVLSDVDITLHDGVESGDVDSARFKTEDGRLEEGLWSTETLVTDGDDLTIRKLVRLLEGRRLAGGLNLLLEVKGDIAELLLDVTNDFALGGGGERVTALGENLHEVVGQITTSHVDTGDGVWKSETLVNWNNVGDTVTRVENDTSGTSRGVKRKDGLDGDVESWSVEGLEDNLGHLLTVGLWVDRSLGEEDWVLFWSNTELVVESVVPNLLHVVPVGDNTVLDRISESEDTTLGLSLITNVRVLLTHTDHDTALCQSLARDDSILDDSAYPW